MSIKEMIESLDFNETQTEKTARLDAEKLYRESLIRQERD